MSEFIERAFLIGRVQYGPGSQLGPRQTIEYEFVRIIKGDVVWTYDNQRHEVGPGSFILSQPGHVEHYRWDTRGVTQHDHIHFTPLDLPEEFPKRDQWPTVIQVDPEDILHGLFQHIVDLNRSGHPKRMELIVQALQHMFLSWVYRLHHFEDRGFRDLSPPLQKLFDHVHERWQNREYRPLSLDDMYRIAGLSRSTFIRLFEKDISMSPSKYFEYHRLHMGRYHLIETNHNVDKISQILGYQNPFHFSRNFKQLFGIAPWDFKHAPNKDEIILDDFAFQRVFTIFSSTQILQAQPGP